MEQKTAVAASSDQDETKSSDTGTITETSSFAEVTVVNMGFKIVYEDDLEALEKLLNQRLSAENCTLEQIRAQNDLY